MLKTYLKFISIHDTHYVYYKPLGLGAA